MLPMPDVTCAIGVCVFSVISRLFQNILSLFPTIHRRQSARTTDPGLRVTYIAAVRLTPRTS